MHCPNNIPTWDAILPEENYDRNASSVKLGMRPLGFMDVVLPYNPSEAGSEDNPCFKVPGTDGKRVEIMIETVNSLGAQVW